MYGAYFDSPRPKGALMTKHTDSMMRRVLNSLRRTYADIDHASRLLMDANPDRRH